MILPPGTVFWGLFFRLSGVFSGFLEYFFFKIWVFCQIFRVLFWILGFFLLLVISFLISLDQELLENIWFVCSKSSYSGEKKRCHRAGRWTANKQTRKDCASQSIEAGRLSFVIFLRCVAKDFCKYLYFRSQITKKYCVQTC